VLGEGDIDWSPLNKSDGDQQATVASSVFAVEDDPDDIDGGSPG
jgi:hypothetical protein